MAATAADKRQLTGLGRSDDGFRAPWSAVRPARADPLRSHPAAEVARLEAAVRKSSQDLGITADGHRKTTGGDIMNHLAAAIIALRTIPLAVNIVCG